MSASGGSASDLPIASGVLMHSDPSFVGCARVHFAPLMQGTRHHHQQQQEGPDIVTVALEQCDLSQHREATDPGHVFHVFWY